jgi:hypothetical protein
MTAFSIAVMVGPVSGLDEEGADADTLLCGRVPQEGVDVGIRVRAAAIHIVGPDDARVMSINHGADVVFAFETPGAVAEHIRVLLSRRLRLGDVPVDPLLALGEAIRCQRGVGLDLVIEEDTGLDVPVLDRSIGPGIGGKDWKSKAGDGADKTHLADERDEGGGAHGEILAI